MTWIDLAMSALVAGMVTVVGVGLAQRSRRLALAAVGALVAWLAATALLARAGVFAAPTLPPRPVFLPVAFLAVALLVGRTAAARGLLTELPLHWPVAAQTFRVAVELLLFALHRSGRAPVQVTFEGRNLDLIVGLSAPLVAWLVASRRGGARLLVAWNLAALATLANSIFVVASSTPGPLFRGWPGGTFPALTAWPMIWLPALLAPLAILLHGISLRQALSLRARGTLAPRWAPSDRKRPGRTSPRWT